MDEIVGVVWEGGQGGYIKSGWGIREWVEDGFGGEVLDAEGWEDWEVELVGQEGGLLF